MTQYYGSGTGSGMPYQYRVFWGKRRVDPALIFGWLVCLSVAMITENLHAW